MKSINHVIIIFQSVLREPLPPVLAKMDENSKDKYYETTNGTVHDKKFLGGPYGNGKSNVYKKAPALYNVHYVKDHAEKVGERKACLTSYIKGVHSCYN